MSWYQAIVPHDRIRRMAVVWLEDTDDVLIRVHKGYLLPADEPEWHKQLPEERKQWSDSQTTER